MDIKALFNEPDGDEGNSIVFKLQQMAINDIFKKSADAEITDLVQYGILLDPNEDVLMMIGHIDRHAETKLSKHIYELHKESAALMDGLCNVFAYMYSDQYIVWLLQPFAGGSQLETHIVVNARTSSFKMMCYESFGYSISLLLASRFVAWNKLNSKFISLCWELCEYENIYDENTPAAINIDLAGTIFTEDEIIESEVGRMLEGIRQSLKNGRQEVFYKHFSMLVDKVSEDSGISADLTADIILQLNQIFFSTIRQKKAAGILKPLNLYRYLMNIEESPNLAARISIYHKLARLLFAGNNPISFADINAVLRKIRTYVLDNIGNDLSLVKLSEITNFNPSYLSRLFKMATGKNIFGYVHEVRIKKACMMLRDSSEKINYIAAAVGYDNQQSFSRFFKKEMSISPAQYRVHIRTM
ncbi:MAG: AraC family transcriptional regulator [Defluviitaleaceae bacterium]|nr:AraC family transcriptional regulator [Defluviitaleaceae bacterium]